MIWTHSPLVNLYNLLMHYTYIITFVILIENKKTKWVFQSKLFETQKLLNIPYLPKFFRFWKWVRLHELNQMSWQCKDIYQQLHNYPESSCSWDPVRLHTSLLPYLKNTTLCKNLLILIRIFTCMILHHHYIYTTSQIKIIPIFN